MPSTSKSQQRLFGMVDACKKHKKCASPKIKKIAKSMDKKDIEDFAHTKHKNLPEKKHENCQPLSFLEWIKARNLCL